MAFKLLYQIHYLLFVPMLIYCQKQSHPGASAGLREVVYPVRIGRDGYPHSTHFISKRSTSYVQNFDSNVQYVFPAFGKNISLDLTFTQEFIAPTLVVQHFSGNNTWLDETHENVGLSRCFYAGRINQDLNSRAVFSLCDGLTGAFQFQGEKYLIEPSSEHGPSTLGSLPHYIYKHSYAQKNRTQKSHCDVQENYKHTRRKDEVESRNKNRVEKSSFNSQSAQTEVNSASIHQTSKFSSSSQSSKSLPYRHHRQKRSTSYKRNVEVMVAADNKMLQYHGNDLERYILTLMAIVSSIYRDSSVSNYINIVVVKIAVFRSEQDGPRVTSNAAASLKDFCTWQYVTNPTDDSNPDHYDTAVLITRQDICRARYKCDTLGLAELGTMCDPRRSCSIIEDNGISAAFTIAHELGHVFSLPHDDNKRCKKFLMGPYTDHIMSPTLDHNTSPWTWSYCSSELITRFIDAGSAECLLDRPGRRRERSEKGEPGELYSIDKQCELMFGPDFKICPYMLDCKRLWCTDSKSKSKGCKTLHMPWADGTKCGAGKWCQRGTCVTKSIIKAIDGNWGGWEVYGDCTTTCGGGVRMAIRKCNSPTPANGGRYCTGRRTRYKSCNTKPCDPGSKDFREIQCSAFDNNLKLQGLPSNVRWVPKYAGIRLKDACKLYCRASASSAFYLLKDKVVDGTKCGPDTFDMCVNGICQKAGCDNKLGSNMVVDRCGICGGDNSTCRMERVFNRFNLVNLTYGYNYVHTMPTGAREIVVKQHGVVSGLDEDGNFLALKNGSQHFLLNGNKTINVAKTRIRVAGAWIEYSGSGAVVEKINATGPIQESISLWVLSVGELFPPNIEYTYVLNVESRFVWSWNGPWESCNRTCQGYRTKSVVCISDDAERTVVSDKKCERHPIPKPISRTERCNMGCTLRWEAERHECSARCGEGVAKQTVRCVKKTGWREETVSEDLVMCSGDCNPAQWQYTEWSRCTKTCNGGFQERVGRCMDYRQNELPDSECEDTGKVMIQKCNEQPCPEWHASAWNGCSHTCGSGIRHRKIFCYQGKTKVSEKECDRSSRPSNVEVCNKGSCPIWHTSGWERCSVSCGHGVSVRNVQCRSIDGQILRGGICDPSSRPYDTRKCYMGPCPLRPPQRSIVAKMTNITTTTTPTTTPTTTTDRATTTTTTRQPVKWRASDWSQCSVTCGEGRRNRFVRCEDSQGYMRSPTLCGHLDRPVSSEACTERPCGYWRSGPWGQCSVTCGEGERVRQVICFNYNHQRTAVHQCNAAIRPETSRKCQMTDCPGDVVLKTPKKSNISPPGDWRTGPWTKCSVSCDAGWQRRLVVCLSNNEHSEQCDVNRKPEETRICNMPQCPSWKTGLWSQCSVTCGGDGIQSRRVTCEMGNTRIVQDFICNSTRRPVVRQACNNGPCQTKRRWKVNPWQSCSVTCGRGHQQRDIKCVDDSGNEQDPSECPRGKPRSLKQCHMGRCPKWYREKWSKCSVTCGKGVKVRTLTCKTRHFQIVDSSYCSITRKPKTQRVCSRRPCSNYSWRREPWSQCSQTCGFGTKTRSVYCVDRRGQRVDESLCGQQHQPKSRRRCNEFPCPYIWNTSPWTECNATCGEGIQTRTAVCQAVTKEGWILPGSVPYGCRQEEKPPTIQRCNFGDCGSAHHWVVGSWGKCSSRCGWGKERRLVLCVDVLGRRRSRKQCPLELRPIAQQKCYSGPCYARSCLELKEKTKIRHDDMYSLLVKRRILQIYCKNMRKQPQEYISLSAGNNFAEIYGLKLQRPNNCPNNGTRPDVCKECRGKHYKEAGNTTYTKIRIDLASLRVITNDTTFTTGSYGKSIPFATAGDCYSSQGNCPQGRFSINLAGTGFIVSQNSSWALSGPNASKKIHILNDGEIVRGQCGGYCGKCIPDPVSGLQLDTRH
ncbi:A disintegrin and metalloproteinase with thrombospondin motifs 9-like [Ostrea edulis]|uniref:A disintegrin and metalloproteinase with thrombospondin motifs 9-like n=1 Tax=Ostrea edulis TaxID=37623 RepID=UPI0024AF9F2A|nr:A disintegrin and metalloproteinase with thrombospondin motifs 9-like [Ostrea edulis]